MRCNYREVQRRFTHIDGAIARMSASFQADNPESLASVTLSFYPWWEHPLYIEARDHGTPWAFSYNDDAQREVVVHAVAPRYFESRGCTSATDIAFLDDHPVLWMFQQTANIICNTEFSPADLIQRLAKRVPHADRQTILQFIDPFPPHKVPYSIGYFPFTLYHHVLAELRLMSVDVFTPHQPSKPDALVAFVVDDDVVMIAQDYEIDVPDFAHRPEWFRPSG